MKPQLVEMSAEDYFRDPCRTPSLSQSTAHTLLSRSPYHAWLYHPKLGGRCRAPTEEMDLGNIVHELLLGTGKGFAVAEYSSEPTADDALAEVVERFEAGEDIETPAEPPPATKGRKPRAKKPPEPPPVAKESGKPEWQNWLRGDAKAARDAIRARGLVPVLPKDMRIAKALARDLRAALDRFDIHLEDGNPEVVALWEEPSDLGPVVCRGMLDCWHPHDPRGPTIYDLKTTAKSAHPRAIQRDILDRGCDIQAAAYTSAIERIYPQAQGRVRFVLLYCEVSTGLVTPVELAGSMRRLGELRWRRAVETWARCLRENRWPGYAESITTIEAPEWAMADEMTASGVAWGDRITGGKEGHDGTDDESF